MRYSQAFIPTVKETPADAVIASHQLMIRAGLIRALASGIYQYLPLGWRVLRKAENIIRDEMNAAGAQELHLPVIMPLELFRKTGRDAAFGDNLFRLTDRHAVELAMGPTHEEVITTIVANHINSYRQLPLNLYQIQTKFRDEERPKSGVLRTREFLMKDAYSFHTDVECLDRTYEQMYKAYQRIYTRAGLPYVAVEADSGPIGGSASHEFMVTTEVGEDIMVACTACTYAANVERAVRQLSDDSAGPASSDNAIAEVHTPGSTTIDQVTALLNISPDKLIKTLVYTSGDKVIVALVRGDHDVNEPRLMRALEATELEMADAATIEKLTGAAVGFAGPVGIKPDVLIADPDVMDMADAVTGANKTDYHITGVQPGRDFTPDVVDQIRLVTEGDRCPECGGKLSFKRCIEVGHVFKLGTKYSAALGAEYLDDQGAGHAMIMGCYGIGVNRIIAAAIECSHDDDGIIWPISIAPYQVLLVGLNLSDDATRTAAETLYAQLTEAGLEVLFDDRDARPGVKFKDADLIGIPLRVTIGPKGVAQNNAEIKLRRGGDMETCSLDATAARVIELVRQLLAELTP